MPRAQKICDRELLAKAVEQVNKGVSVYKASRLFNIPESTLRDHAKGKYKGYETTFGRSRCLTEVEETTLVSYIEYMADRGFPLTRQMIKVLATEVIKESGRQTLINTEKGPSDIWMKKFFNRHPQLSVRKAHTLDKARASVEQNQLDQYFQLLQSTIQRLHLSEDPGRIYNCDETGFSGSLGSSGRNVVTMKGVRQAFRVQMTFSGHVTVHFAISAIGKTLPPFVIFSQNMPRASYSDGLPEDWQFAHTESGFINSDLFFKWFTELFIPACGVKRPCLLLMDNLAAHLTTKVIDAARDNEIDLLYFPSHCSHLLQPLDVGYFHVLKSNVVDLAHGLGYAGARCLPRHLFPKVIHHAMNKISPSVVAAAFSATGIFPFNGAAAKALATPIPTSSHCESTATEAPVSTGTSNMLVRIGMVPESLAKVFLEPPAVTGNRKRKNALPYARLIQSDLPPKKTSVPQLPNPEHSDGICIVCMTDRADLFWVGCDSCDGWYHYECLPATEQTDVDFSLVCRTSWSCLACRGEE